MFDEGRFPRSPMFLDLKIPIVIDIGFGIKGQIIPSALIVKSLTRRESDAKDPVSLHPAARRGKSSKLELSFALKSSRVVLLARETSPPD